MNQVVTHRLCHGVRQYPTNQTERDHRFCRPLDEDFIVARKIFNNNTNMCGEPSGSRMAAVDDASPTRSGVSVETNASPRLSPEVQRFPCDFCDRVFDTKIGQSQHIRLRHLLEYNESVQANSSSSRRWCGEERAVLAELEVQAVEAGVSGSLDRHLSTVFTSRTLEAIKGQRRQIAYKTLLEQVKAKRTENARQVTLKSNVSKQTRETVETLGNPDGAVDDTTAPAACNDRFDKAFRMVIAKTLEELSKSRSQIANRLASAAKVFLRSVNEDNRMFRVMEWLNDTLARNKKGGGGNRSTPGKSMMVRNGSRRSRIKQEYAILQKLFSRSKKRAFQHILDPKGVTNTSPAFTADMFEFWGNTYEGRERQVIAATSSATLDTTEEADRIWSPITEGDVQMSEPGRTTAAGPDGVTAKQWRSIPPGQRALFYNILMAHGQVGIDPEIIRARTVFIPKVDRPQSPDKFRPIGITSVIIRQLHSIYAKRLRAFRGFDNRQRAFCNVDGTAENLLTLKAVMDEAQRERGELHVVSIDIQKAFDSASHSSIIEAITAIGCPTPFVNYVKWVYNHAATNLQYGGHRRKVKVINGVLQGDPLSPVVFNYLIDRALQKLDGNIGYNLKGQMINCMAFADDIVLVSGSIAGMNHNLSKLVGALSELGLKININKSQALSLIPAGKEKKVFISTKASFHIDGAYLKQLGIKDEWKYLGVRFQGFQVKEDVSKLLCQLEKIGRARLKPQQKYLLLRSHLIPKHLHELVLGKASKQKLESLDISIRRALRTWLKLPHDTPVAYFHAKVKVGGLSIPALLHKIPQLRLARNERVAGRGCPITQAVAKTEYYNSTSTDDRKLLVSCIGGVDKEAIATYWENELNGKIDTKDLSQSKHCSVVNAFIWSKALRWKARHYVHMHHVRVGCLPSLSRRNRGRDNEALCRAGCGKSESNYHIIQQCHRTKGGRILSHNRVVNLLADQLSKQEGLNVVVEPFIHTTVGLRKPDIIVSNGIKATVLDVNIVSGHNMEADRKNKTQKYQSIPGFDRQVMARYGCSEQTEFGAITLSYKGIFEKTTAAILRKLRVTKQALYNMSVSVLNGSWMNWCTFNVRYWSRQ